MNKRLLNPLCILIVLAAALAAAGPAAADVVPEGTGEPAYTNSTQNTQFFRVTEPGGIDDYRLKFSYYANNALVAEQTMNNASPGVIWANWSGVAMLQHGGQYGICVQGYYSFPNDSLYIPDGPNSCSAGTNLGRRSYTTIDRSKPSIAVAAAGGADTTKDSSIPVSVAFSDDVAGPYPSTWTCVTAGSDPCTQFDYSAQCSVPGAPGKSTTFSCTADASQLPDGPVTVCARQRGRLRAGQPELGQPGELGRPGEPVGRPVRHGHARPERPGARPGHPGSRHPRSGHPRSRHSGSRHARPRHP